MRYKLELPVSIPGREATAKGIAALQKQLDLFGRSSIGTQQLEAFQAEIAVTAEQVIALAKAMKLDVDTDAIRETGRALAEAIKVDTDPDAIRETAQALTKLKQDADAATQDFVELQQASQSLNVALGNLASDAVRAGIQKLGDTLAGSVEAFRDYEQGVTQFRAISGESGESIGSLEEQIKNLGANTAKSAGEISAATVDLARIGISAEQSAALLPSLVKASIATGQELNGLSTAVGGVASQFGELDSGTARLEGIASTLVSVANNSNTTVAELSDGLKNSAGAARTLGLSVEDSTFALGVFAQAGVQGAEAGTTFRSVLSKLGQAAAVMGGDFEGKVSPGIQRSVKALEQYGVELTDTNGKILSTPQLFTNLAGAFESMGSETEQLTVASQLFGEEYASKVVAALQLGEAEFSKQAAAAFEAGDALSRTADTMGEGLAGAFDLLSSATEGFQIAVGEELGPALEGMVRAAAGVISTFANSPPIFQKAAIGVGALGATLTAAVAVMSAYNAVMASGAIATAASQVQTSALTLAKGASTVATGLATIATKQLTVAQIAEAASAKAAAVAAKTKQLAVAGAGKAVAASTLQFAAFAGAAAGVVAAGLAVADTFKAIDGAANEVRQSTSDLATAMNEAKVAAGEVAEVDFEENLNGFQRGLDGIRGAIPGLTTAAEASAQRQQVAYGELVQQSERNLAVSQELALSGEVNAESAKKQVAAIDANIAALQKNLPVTEDQKAAQETLIASLERTKEQLEGKVAADAESTASTESSTDAVQGLEGAYAKLAASVEEAKSTLASDGASEEDLEAAAKSVLDTSKQLQDAGQLSAEQAIKNLQAVATNTQLSADVQIQAEEEITKLKEQELQNRLADYQLAQDELEADIKNNRISQIDGEKELTQSRINALDEELKLRKERIEELNELGRGDGQEATETLQQVHELEQEKEAIALESAQRISELRLEELEKEQAKARQIIELSQVEQENTLKRLRLQGQAGSAEEAQAQLKIEKDRLDEEVKLVKRRNAIELEEKRKLFEESLKFASNEDERDELRRNFNEETADLERQAAIDQAELEGDLLQNRLDAEEQVREEILRTAEAQSTIANLALDTQLNKNQEIEDSLARQGELIAQQNALFEAQNALQQSQTNLRLNGLERALTATKALEDEEDPIRRKQLEEELTALGVKRGSSELDIIKSKQKAEDELAQQQFQALQEQLRSKQLETELEIESNRLAAERLILETQSATLAREDALIKAQVALQADPTNVALQAQLKVAEKQLENANAQAAKAEEGLTRLDDSAAKQRELLNLEQQRLVNEAKQAEKFRELDQAQEFAGLGVQNATRLAQAGGPDLNNFTIPTATSLGGAGSSLAGLPELSLSLPNLPELQVSKDNPLNQNLEGLRGDFKELAAVLLNQPPPQVNVTAQTSRQSGPSGGEFGRAAIGAVGLG